MNVAAEPFTTARPMLRSDSRRSEPHRDAVDVEPRGVEGAAPCCRLSGANEHRAVAAHRQEVRRIGFVRDDQRIVARVRAGVDVQAGRLLVVEER